MLSATLGGSCTAQRGSTWLLLSSWPLMMVVLKWGFKAGDVLSCLSSLLLTSGLLNLVYSLPCLFAWFLSVVLWELCCPFNQHWGSSRATNLSHQEQYCNVGCKSGQLPEWPWPARAGCHSFEDQGLPEKHHHFHTITTTNLLMVSPALKEKSTLRVISWRIETNFIRPNLMHTFQRRHECQECEKRSF